MLWSTLAIAGRGPCRGGAFARGACREQPAPTGREVRCLAMIAYAEAAVDGLGAWRP
jgi:hypothetical protein